VPYTNFWHRYLHEHAASHTGGGAGLSLDPAALFAVAVCLFVIACWAAYQLQSRCPDCGAIPARCRCARRTVRDR
jgi:hypothetical protein